VTEQELLVDSLRRLHRAGIEYLLTGSMASNYWGMPRTTHDLDFVVQLAPASVEKFVREFAGDFHIDEMAVRGAFQPPHQFNAIDTRSALKVDFWILRNEPFEREMFARRRNAVVFGEPAWIATPEDVILHKLFWNRITPSERQLNDAAGVFAVQRELLDLEYMRGWAKELQVSEKLDDIMSGKIRPKST
jgi:hypothetical protein